MHSRKKRQSGSALVEFALTVPIFMLIVFGLIEFGIVFAGYCGAAYASQVAVRYAVVHGVNASGRVLTDDTAMQALVVPYLWAAQSGGYSISENWNPDDSIGSTVTVNIALTYNIGIPFWKINTVQVGTSATGTVLF